MYSKRLNLIPRVLTLLEKYLYDSYNMIKKKKKFFMNYTMTVQVEMCKLYMIK